MEEVIPFLSIPEALLFDQGTNLLSTLMLDVCDKLGIQKFNTMAYHPQCNSLVECFNRTLKTMLRKQAATYQTQWHKFYQSPYGHIKTPHIRLQGRNPHFCYLAYIVVCHQWQRYFPLLNQSQLKSSLTTDRNWLYHYHL